MLVELGLETLQNCLENQRFIIMHKSNLGQATLYMQNVISPSMHLTKGHTLRNAADTGVILSCTETF